MANRIEFIRSDKLTRIIGNLECSDVFECDGKVYMKTNSGPSAHGACCCVNVVSGELAWLRGDLLVAVLTATIHVDYKSK